MKYVFSLGLCSAAFLACYLGIRFYLLRGKNHLENRLFTIFAFASAIWGFGFGCIPLQTDTSSAYICRAIGMIGVFLYLSVAQILVCHLSTLPRILTRFINAVSLSGFIIYFFIIQKNQTHYYIGRFGMTYNFRAGFWNTAYTLYSVIVACNILFVVIHIYRHTMITRMRAFCREFMYAEVIIFFGMLFDTVYPLFGMPAVPGSSITQFLGFFVVHHAIAIMDRCRINLSNMSEFIYGSLAMPVLVYDCDRKLQILNSAAHTFFDIPDNTEHPDTIPIEELFDLEDQDIFAFQETQITLDCTCRKNFIYCNLSVSRIHDSYGDTIGYIILVADLSERMKTMQDLEAAIIEAQCANQAKSTFLANMSHEIRTPMNAIMGFSELVLKMDISDDVREYVQDIKCSSQNLLAIINDILDISKIESGKMELVCSEYYTATLLNDVCMIIDTQAKKKGLDFHIHVEKTLPKKLYGDKIRVRGILVNILNNAVKYTREGHVEFDVSICKRTTDTVSLLFRITDTGSGIKQEDIPTLFKSFEQLNQKFHYGVEGSGLGLAIVKGYVDLMGGEISVDSTFGKGSTFIVVLDQKIVDPEPVNLNFSGSDPADNNSIGNLKVRDTPVLVVDDNQVNLRVAKSSLSYYGFAVDTATNGPDAIGLCREKTYRIVFLDQMMPDMDGVETMRQIRALGGCYAQGGDSKLIVLTANAISGIRDNLMKDGFDEYLGKPMNFRQLERLIKRFLPPECIYYEGTVDSATRELSTQELEMIDFFHRALTNIDTDYGIRNCGGSPEDYLSVLEIVWKYGEKQLAELTQLHADGDYENYKIKVHSMKSMTLNLGARDVSALAKQLEEAGQIHRYEFIDSHFEEFNTLYRKMLTKLHLVLKRYGRIEQETSTLVSIPDDALRLILGNIRHCLDEFQFTQIFTILDETKKYCLSEEWQHIFDQIATWMEDLSVDRIRKLIDRTLQD